MDKSQIDKHVLGRAEYVSFVEIDVHDIPARIDTGAQTSAIWASDIHEEADGGLSFVLFDVTSPHHQPHRHYVNTFTKSKIKSTIGVTEERYKVLLLLECRGRRIRASFTLANRSRQVYPVLVGRNVLSGKFIVDVSIGEAHVKKQTADHIQENTPGTEGDRL